MTFTENGIQKILKVYKFIYTILIALATIGLSLSFLLFYLSKKSQVNTVFAFLLLLIISFIFYKGISHRKSWIVPVISIFAGIGIFYSFLNFQIKMSVDKSFFTIVLQLIAFSWNIFTLYFFTKKEVRDYFNYKNDIIF